METLQTILFFAIGAIILFMTVSVAFFKKKFSSVFGIAKWALLLLVSSIFFTYGKPFWGIGVLVGGVLLDRFMVKKGS